jgi:small neutral amino acid transporter SnatA (MarC family)
LPTLQVERRGEDRCRVNLQILPLATTMMAGPQIMSAIIFVTAERAVPLSFAFVVGVAIATTLGVVVVYLLGNSPDLDLGDPSDAGSKGRSSSMSWWRCWPWQR